MSLEAVTSWILLALVVGLTVYDVVPALTKARGDTISEVTRDYAFSWLAIPLGYGVLGGHFFSPVPRPDLGLPGLAYTLGLAVLVLGYDIVRRRCSWRATWLHRRPWVGLLAGLAFGGTVWSQAGI